MSKFMKSLCKIAIPVTLQSMLQASFSIVDQIMIGQLGETNISAVGLCGNFSLIFSVVIGAVSTVAGILIAQFIGAEDTKEAWCSFDVSLICGIVISALQGACNYTFFSKFWSSRCKHRTELPADIWKIRTPTSGNERSCDCNTYFAVV